MELTSFLSFLSFLSFFLRYQISSDLFAFSGAEDASAAERIAAVKGHVEKLMVMIRKGTNDLILLFSLYFSLYSVQCSSCSV